MIFFILPSIQAPILSRYVLDIRPQLVFNHSPQALSCCPSQEQHQPRPRLPRPSMIPGGCALLHPALKKPAEDVVCPASEYTRASTPSLGHPGAREDVAGVAAREGDDDSLVDLLVPFQMAYEDGVERLAAESLLERQKWVNRIWEAVHRPVGLPDSPPPSSGSASAGADDADESSSSKEGSVARAGSIRTIESASAASLLREGSVQSQGSVRSNGSNGSRSTVFVPPMGELESIAMGADGDVYAGDEQGVYCDGDGDGEA
ncbi:hypothetical protein B0H14DRAFT_3449175 [Mycena olivaceomarginata]|nr:hypothetical protein B0H14DRAFT_3449175 [Mycena olivaceomarginata]